MSHTLLFNSLFFWQRVQPHSSDRFAVSDTGGPTPGILFLGLEQCHFSARQDVNILALMAMGRGHITDRAMAMLVVVPADEHAHPVTGQIKALKALRRVFRTLFGGTEQRLDISVVIGHTRSAVGRCDTQCLECGRQSAALSECTTGGLFTQPSRSSAFRSTVSLLTAFSASNTSAPTILRLYTLSMKYR